MPPVSPGQPSSFGSVLADTPGLLRENGYTFTYTCNPGVALQDMPICSGLAPAAVTDYQPVLAPLNPGDTLSIFGIQGACAAGVAPMEFALRVGSHNTTDPILMVGSSNRNGPWFQHFELPIQIEGPSSGTTDVWLEIMEIGNSNQSFNKITLECFVYRKSS